MVETCVGLFPDRHVPISVIAEQCQVLEASPDVDGVLLPDQLASFVPQHARALTYLQTPGWGDSLCAINGWSTATLADIRNQPQLREINTIADNVYHRSELVEPARCIPEKWMKDSCAIGMVSKCVAQLRAFRDAGADEIVTYGSTPAQNAALAAAWRTATSPETGSGHGPQHGRSAGLHR